jgi:isoquinoline 1-oxidoreductase beta subunit
MLQKAPPPVPTSRFRPTRRGLLLGVGAALGVGVGFLLWPRRWPEPALAGDGEVALNAWVRVAPDGLVTLAIPQAEMGQGSWSGLAQILGDEMGADWSKIAVEPAPFHPAYAAVGMAAMGTAGLPPVLRDIAAFAGASAIRRLNLHMTGGSTSIKGYHDIVREAGAAARAIIVGAAARAWKVSASEIDTAGGFALYKANRLPFADAVADARLEDAEAAALRPLGSGRLAGKPLPRIDLPPKVDGTARFGGDVRLPGMVFAAIRHGPVGNGRLVSATAPASIAVVEGANWVATTGPTNFAAQQALEQVKARFTTDGKAAGPWITDALRASLAQSGGKAVAEKGDVEASLGGKPVSADYAVPFLAHACMEPMVATARLSDDGRIELWGPTQSLTLAHMAVARALDIEKEKITIYPTLVGGGFGRKAEADHFVEAALIARAIGKPVQLQWTRDEDLHADMFRPAAAARMRGAVGPDGRITGFDATIAVPSPGFSFMNRNVPAFAPSRDKPNGAAIEGAAELPYALPAMRAVHVPMETPVPLGYWRSVGHSFSAFFIEAFMDELAAAAGKDPVAFRLAHLGDSPRHAAVLKAVAGDARWDEASPAGFAKGVALHESFGSIVGMVVEAGVVDGAVVLRRVWSAVDCGRAINPDSVRAQIDGGALHGLCAAINARISFADGRAEQTNFDGYPILRLIETPAMSTRIIESGAPLGGIGEPGTPPAAPALANALAAATGVRARTLPLGAAFAA